MSDPADDTPWESLEGVSEPLFNVTRLTYSDGAVAAALHYGDLQSAMRYFHALCAREGTTMGKIGVTNDQNVATALVKMAAPHATAEQVHNEGRSEDPRGA
jgi:hypothetical protein